ncbi:MAG: signal peptidase I [Chloroflexi bacterium]|nr:signal peptidase I [Chloroflexota bacterium]
MRKGGLTAVHPLRFLCHALSFAGPDRRPETADRRFTRRRVAGLLSPVGGLLTKEFSLSGLFDPHDPNTPAEPEGVDPNPQTPPAVPPVEADSSPPPAIRAEPESSDLPFKTSEATSPNLATFLATQRPGEPAQPPAESAPDHVFRVSPAEPDWATYTLPPLEDEPPAEGNVSSWKTAWAVVREVGETIILTLIIFFLIQTVIRNFRVVGTSMVNNLHDGQYLIIDKLSYSPFVTRVLSMGGPQRGDVIVFEPPNRPGEDYVKRIIGLPGEVVEVRAGQVFINGEALTEPFEPTPGTYTMSDPVVVPEGQVFVLGDNRNNSNDSHNWGTLPVDKIVGRAWLSYWPPPEWGIIPRDEPTEQATLRHFLNELVPSANADNN